MSIIPHIVDTTDPAECWTILKDLYEHESVARSLMLKQKLHNLRIQEGKNIKETLKEIRELTGQLARIDYKIPKDELVDLVFKNLSKS